jgi:hypothetical protein
MYTIRMASANMRAEPRISVNKLAEYMTASAARRRGIIRDQKVRREVIVARYQDVYAGIADCLASGHDLDPIYKRIERLYRATAKSAWELQNNQLSAEALEVFLSFVDEIDLEPYDVIRPAQTLPLMPIAGLGVSVRPAVLLRMRGGSRIVGAVHLALSKLFALGDETAAYATTIVHQFVETTLAAEKVDPSGVLVVDVFARKVHIAPRTYKKRRKNLEAACEEIAQRWAAV